MGGAVGAGGGRSCRCVFPIPDYPPPPPPDFLHQITSTSWPHLFLYCLPLHCIVREVVGRLLAIKLIPLIGQTVRPAAKRLMADSHDPIGFNGSRQDSIQHQQIRSYFKSGHRPAFRGIQTYLYVHQLYVLCTERKQIVMAVKF